MRKAKSPTLTFLKSLSLPILITLGIFIIALALWQIPQWQLSSKKLSSPDKQAEMENAYRTTLVQALGGVFFFVTAYFTWRNVKAAEEKQVTERFSKAIEQLGNDNIHVRLGGIYALERIANDSEKDYWQVIEVLTAYIREKAPLPPIKKNEKVPFWSHNTAPIEAQKEDIPPIPTDIQAVLTVLTRRRYALNQGEKHPLDLNRTNLQSARLEGVNLQSARLEGANLQSARLEGANLQSARLEGANLQLARLKGASLQSASLWRANLEGAMLDGILDGAVNLEGAMLGGANLQSAMLGGANLQSAMLGGANLQLASLDRVNLQSASLDRANLQSASLGRANLQSASLEGANLQGVILWEANLQSASLEGANLKNVQFLKFVVGLTREQITQIDQDQSNIDEAMLPDYLQLPKSSHPKPPDPEQT